MKNNLVIAIFKVENEAFQAFSELSGNPAGKDYNAPEAALIKKNQKGGLDTLEVYGEAPAGKTAVGAVIGGLIGLIGGPIGALVGAAIGGVAGGFADTAEVIDETSIIAVVASKIYEGEVAIAALVEEEEPAFDAAFAKYETTIIRYDAETIAAEVKEFKENGTDKLEQAIKEAVAAAEDTGEQPEVKEELTGWRSATNRVLENE
jgi:uncharacterized membrane protein